MGSRDIASPDPCRESCFIMGASRRSHPVDSLGSMATRFPHAARRPIGDSATRLAKLTAGDSIIHTASVDSSRLQ